ncbi:MAG: alpha/beta hydrolase [Candidatus Moraniibacteriota bacterium]|nr:MAG: alpha/beta hydrolase [Candidatus Moranbacteria bacterium]
MTKGGIARTVAGMLQTVAKTPFFGGVAQKVVIRYLKQVSKYVGDPATRAEARKAVIGVIRSDTTLLVGHSLGSVVAWEALCANPELPVRTFITIGSPLGVPALLSRLNPSVDTRPGPWPAGILRWVNIADGRDVVALEKCLARVFGSKVDDYFVDNGATMHDVSPYLTSREMGRAVTTALA